MTNKLEYSVLALQLPTESFKAHFVWEQAPGFEPGNYSLLSSDLDTAPPRPASCNYIIVYFTGFLSTGDRHLPGNYGMWDQIRALEFVRKVIRDFRGNPEKITLMGHSTGAVSVGLHIVSPRSQRKRFNVRLHSVSPRSRCVLVLTS